MYTRVPLFGCVHLSAGAFGARRCLANLWELELRMVVNHLMWVLGTEFGSYLRAAHTLNY